MAYGYEYAIHKSSNEIANKTSLFLPWQSGQFSSSGRAKGEFM